MRTVGGEEWLVNAAMAMYGYLQTVLGSWNDRMIQQGFQCGDRATSVIGLYNKFQLLMTSADSNDTNFKIILIQSDSANIVC